MENSINIRPAITEDARDIALLTNELGYRVTAEETANNLSIIQRNIFEMIFVAERKPEIIGWIQVSYLTRLESGTFCEISGMVVKETYRKKGVGKLLVNAAVKWSKGKSCSKLTVKTNVLRINAGIFYEQMGFELIKNQKVFELSI